MEEPRWENARIVAEFPLDRRLYRAVPGRLHDGREAYREL